MPEHISIDRRVIAGTVTELHALAMPTEGDRAELWIMRPTQIALAMGSSQRPELFDRDQLVADSIELAPRRSGGGAVFIDPASTVWIDVLAPRTSPLWSNDLTENFLIVGRIWQRALLTLGIETELCTTSPLKSSAATLACWAGLGWGELTHGEAKLVGLSQRRTRWGARIQAMAVLDASSRRVANYLGPQDRDLVAAAIGVTSVSARVEQIEAAVVAAFHSLT